MAVVGSAQVLIRPSFSGMQREINRELQGAGEDAGRTGGRSMGDSLKKWGKRGAAVAGVAIAAGVGTALKTGFDRLTAIEDAEAMLRGLGHSAEDVSSIMQNAMDATEGTAIRMDDMATTAAQMVAAGIEPGKELEEVLRLVGDSATIAGGDMDGMSQIFGKVAAANRMSMQEVNQMHERGIPILQMVADEMGVTQEAAREMVSAGEVDFDTFSSAMETGLGGAAQQAGETTRGALSNLGAYVARAGASLLDGIMPHFREGVNSISEWLQGMEPMIEEWGEKIGEWVGKAAEAVGNFIQEFRDGEGAGGRFRDILETVWGVLQDTFNFVKDTVVPVLRSMWDWLTENKDVVLAVAAGVAAAKIGLVAWNAIVRTAAAVTAAWEVVQRVLNGTLRANPIGIVVTILGLLVGAIVLAWQRSETFRNVVKGAWEGIKTAVSAVWNWLKGVFESMKSGMASVGNWFSDRGQDMENAWNSVKNALGAAWRWIDKNVFGPIKSGLSAVGRWFTDRGNDIKGAWDSVKNALKAGYDFIKKWTFDAFVNGVRIVWNFFKNRVDDIKGAWNGLKSAFKAVWDWIKDNVFDRFRKGIERIAGWVSDAVSNIDKAWRKIANKFRNPINWVINTVWNDGIAKVFNSVADAIGIKTRLSRNASIPRFAEGGRHRGGWALVGEEGPELVNFSDPSRIYTAAETAEALSQGRDLTEQESRAAAGSSPSEALAPMGGNWLSRAWNAVTGWVRGGLAKVAKTILDPITRRISSTMSQWGSTGDLFGDTMKSSVDSLVTWIRGEDDKAVEGDVHGGPPPSRGGWTRPSHGPITSRFGPRWGSHHAGIDIAGGGPTYAAADGTVLNTGWNILAGRTGIGIGISHGGGVFSYYGHNPVGGVAVRPGQEVRQGQRVGRQGATGNVTGVHLHYELHRGGWGRAVNPEQLGVFDSGGDLLPGMLGANLSRKPEVVLTNQVIHDINRLASSGSGGAGVFHLYDSDDVLIGTMRGHARSEIDGWSSGTQRAQRALTGSVR